MNLEGEPALDMVASEVAIVATPDAETFGIVPADTRRFAVIAMGPKLAEGVIVGLLQAFHAHTKAVEIPARETAGELEGVPVQQLVLGIGEAGQPILSVTVGSLRLNLLLPASGTLRQLARNATDAADLVDRHRHGTRQ